MQLIKNWALGLVLVSVLGSGVLILSPSGNIERQLRTAVSLVMLICFVAPFLTGYKQDSINIEETFMLISDSYGYYGSPLVETFENDLEGKINDCLAEIEIYPNDVIIEIVQTGNEEVSVEGLTVLLDCSDTGRENEVCNLIKDKYGILATVEVIN